MISRHSVVSEARKVLRANGILGGKIDVQVSNDEHLIGIDLYKETTGNSKGNTVYREYLYIANGFDEIKFAVSTAVYEGIGYAIAVQVVEAVKRLIKAKCDEEYGVNGELTWV